MSHPDDARFRPGDPTPDDYDVGEGYGEAHAPGFIAPKPYDDVEIAGVAAPPTWQQPPQTSPWGMPGPAQPGLRTGMQRPAATVPSVSPSLTGPPRPQARRRFNSTWIAVGALAFLVLAQLVGAVVSRFVGDDGADPDPWAPTAPAAADMEAAWLLEAQDLTHPGDEDYLARNPDGAFTGPQIIEGDAAWVVAWETEDVSGWVTAGIAALDPADGTVLWERPMPGVLCADRALENTLRCLHEEDGTWVYHQIDIATGQDTVTVDTSLEAVQTVHANAEVLVAVGPADPAPHAQMTGFALDGSELWSIDIAEVENAEMMFAHFYDSAGDPVLERPRWRDLEGGLMMLWATPGVAIIDPASGHTFVHHCRAGTAQGDHYLCQDDDGLNRHALDGTITWSLPDVRLTVPEDRSDATPVAITEPTDNQYEVVPVDWETGEITGAATYRFGQQPGVWTGIVLPPSAYTLEDVTIVGGDTDLVALDPETGELLWSKPLEDGSYVFGIAQVGDVAVIDAGTNAVGLDLATGDLLWTLRNTGDELTAIEGLLVSTGFEIGVMEVP